jgi:small subunit ribosomal protein S16
MALVIRLRKLGARGKPHFRIAVTESTTTRSGRFVEEIGWYDPKKEGVNFKVDAERARYWLSKGAKPTETVRSILKRHSQLGKAPAAPAAEAPAEPKAEAEAPAPEPEPTPAAEEPAEKPAEGPAKATEEEPKTDEPEPTPETPPEATEPTETDKQ